MNNEEIKTSQAAYPFSGCSNMACTYSTCRIAHEKLIAAAPDLLEALQAMLIVHDHGECEAMHPDTAERMARDALAKAGVQS